jgi:hypothetical protein
MIRAVRTTLGFHENIYRDINLPGLPGQVDDFLAVVILGVLVFSGVLIGWIVFGL